MQKLREWRALHGVDGLAQYHQYRHGRYPIPNDDKEQNRDDMKHAMMLELTEYVIISSFPGFHM